MSKVGFFQHQKSGCFWYRIKRVHDVFQRNGIETRMIALNQNVDDDISAFQLYGATPFSMAKPLEWMKEEKKKIVYDVDDALHLIDDTNPFRLEVMRDIPSMEEKLRYADEITVSTPEIAKYLKGRTNAPITVIPNTFTASEWTFPRPIRSGLRIGFSGSPTHVGDLLLVLPAIRNLQKKHNFTFILHGFSKADSYQDWFNQYRYQANEKSLKELLEFDKLLSEINFEFVPFVDFELHPAVLTNMALDIGICPLKPTPFNICRSACKAMEYTLSGALALASDTPPYQMDKSSILVKDDEWEKTLELYIENPLSRKYAQQQHLQWIKENREDISNLESLKKVYGIQM